MSEGFSGEIEQIEITHRVKRPGRTVLLASPLQIGPITISKFLARTRDYGNVASIRDPSEDDGLTNDAIVVKGKRASGSPLYFVYLGADALAGCSSIIFDKPTRKIRLSCVPQP
jgi:hypothetical protein